MRRILLAGAVLGGALVGPSVLAAPLLSSPANAATICAGKSYVSGGCVVTITTSKTAVTVKASAPGVTVTLNIQKGTFPPGVTINVQPVGKTSPLAKAIAGASTTSTGSYITAFTVNWSEPNGTVPKAGKPVTMTFSSSSIQPGDLVYELVNGKLLLVGKSYKAGQATITFSADPTFLVLAPSRDGIANDHAKATTTSKVVGVRVACLSGTVCQGRANLDVPRKVNGKTVQKIVATTNFSVVAGQVDTVNLKVTGFGKTVLARMPLFKHFYLGLVTQLSSGQRIARKVALK